MNRSSRRSRRAPKRNSDYNVGDIVEIHRNGVALKARLAQLLTEGTSPNPRWLLKFDGQPYKDEEAYERSFGKLLTSAEEDEPGSSSPNSNSTPASSQRKGTAAKSNSAANGRRTNGSKNGGSSSEGETAEGPKGNKSKTETKTVQFYDESNPGSDVGTDTSGRNSKSSLHSAREERSRRRQAMIDDEINPELSDGLLGGKRGASDDADANKNKRQRGDVEGEVIKVKLLTGTLYIYRGKHRRAEFIRRV